MTKRENKYRGKRIDNGEWAYGNLIKMDAQGSQSFIFPFRNFASTLSCGQIVAYNMVEVDPDTVGQFTGLKDKSGVEIYEGDICGDARGFRFVVTWDERNARFLGHGIGNLIEYIRYVGQEPAVKVIGNIHDNPELLEVHHED